MIVQNGWLVCKMLCYDANLEQLGVENNKWLDCAIKLVDIKAIKDVGDVEDEFFKNTTVIFLDADNLFTIDIQFKDLLKLVLTGLIKA